MRPSARHFVALLIVSAGVLPAQTSKSAPLVLQVPAGTRTLALGNAGVAGRDDDVLFYNPAQLVLVRGSSVSAQRFAPGNATGSLSTVFAFASGAIGFGAQWLGFSTETPIFPYSAAKLDSTGTLTASSVAATIGAGKAIKGIRFGLGAKLAQETALLARSTRGFFDLGVEKDFRQFFGVGLSVQNINPFGVRRGWDPTRITLGTMAEVALANVLPVSPFLDAALAGQLTVLHDGWIKPAGGVELGIAWLQGYAITFRAGARRPEPGERPLTAGLGFNADRVRLDYALETREGGSVAHRIGVRVR